jgi:hypothetical protein
MALDDTTDPRRPRFPSTEPPERLLNGHPPPEPHHRHAMCVGCGCTDASPCRNGCEWIFVDRTPEHLAGLCSNCTVGAAHRDIAAVALARRALTSEFERLRESRRVQAMLLDEKRLIEPRRGTDWRPAVDPNEGVVPSGAVPSGGRP